MVSVVGSPRYIVLFPYRKRMLHLEVEGIVDN